MKHSILFVSGFVFGIGASLLFSKNISEHFEGEENIEQKIEDINVPTNSDLEKEYGDLSSLFSDCDPIEEHKFISERLDCNRKTYKANKHWTNMRMAEKEVKEALVNKNIDKLLSYTSCDAYDLTWYELHCESDRIPISESSFRILFEPFDENGMNKITTSKWKRNKPNRRRIRNPRWLMRSRLFTKQLKLNDPWFKGKHPTEFGTIILLEQKLDGKIYIVGTPVTGVLKSN